MQWLNSLDEVVDRILVSNEGDESVDDSSELSVASDPGPLHHESLTSFQLQTHASDISQPQRLGNNHAFEEEVSDHFVACEQTPGQESMSAPMLPDVIEPDSSMLVEEEYDTKLPTSEPSSSSEPFRPVECRAVHYESEQSTRIPEQAAEAHVVHEQMDVSQADTGTESAYIQSNVVARQEDEADAAAPIAMQDRNPSDDLQEHSRNSAAIVPLHVDMETSTSDLNISNESQDIHLNESFEEKPTHDSANVPAQVMSTNKGDDFTDFYVSLPLPPWDSDIPLDPWLNCYGVVHVRLLCAQRLPCPVGSSVQGILALPPWKGRVRTERTDAFLGPNNSGVCVRWDQLHDGGYCSMVNSWNSLDNPTPQISIDLVFHPFQMLEFPMCSVKLSCAPLMNEPGEWKKQWCQTTITQKINGSEGYLEADERVPLILLEAMFVPSGVEEDVGEDSEHGDLPTVDEEASLEQSPSQGTSGSPTIRSRRHGGGSVGTGASYLLSQRTKSHLLRIQSLWVPASCAVCRSIIVGWKCSYRCESCNIDCCKDCQLQVDLALPCGSIVAEAAVAASFHNKLTVHNIMNAVAPWDETAQKEASMSKSIHSIDTTAQATHDSDEPSGKEAGIGVLQIHIASACIFEKSLHPETDPDDVFKELDDRPSRRGDYYVRLTSNNNDQQSRRTRTIQNSGKPQFNSEEMSLNVPHYGAEYRIDVVDAYTDNPIGMAVLTAQGLLQQYRDTMVAANGFAVMNPFQRPKPCTEKRRCSLELRTGIKNGDYFASTRGRKMGEIVGRLDVDLCMTEATDQLYSSSPIECPPRPPDSLNVELLQAHITRIGTLLGDIKTAIGACSYVVSWKNPALTSLSLILFVTLCLRLNVEYVASLPVFLVVIYVAYLATARKKGQLKERFIGRETRACLETEKKVSINHSVYRPFGRLHISVLRGRNIRSRDLGLLGSAGSRIYWDPLRYCENKKKKELLISIDSSMSAVHGIAKSNFQYSVNPVWDEMYESNETKRLQQLIPSSQGEFFANHPDGTCDSAAVSPETKKETSAFCIFPVLQPIKVSKQLHGNVHGSGSGDHPAVELDEWELTSSAVVVEVRFQDVLNKLPGFDDVLGEVVLPVSQIIKSGEIRGWFRVVDLGSVTSSIDAEATIQPEQAQPEVYLEIKWIPPESKDDNIDSEREASVVIAEEMIRSATQARNAGLDLMGSSIGAFNTVAGLSGHVQMVQNALGSALDMVESIRNAFNFTDPYKSSVLFCALVLLWLFLAMVPFRMLILLGGLGLYASTFSATFFPASPSRESISKTRKDPTDLLEEKVEKQESVMGIWIMNAIRGLPTDEDLRKAYFWESRRAGEQARATLADQKRTARLQKLWKARWYATVHLKTHQDRTSPREARDWHWAEAFAIVQGRRFLWWLSAQDFDTGEPPTGRIFLAGHAGLAGLSPLEMLQLDDTETSLVVIIFGRGLKNQERLTILTDNISSKEALEEAVLEASTKED